MNEKRKRELVENYDYIFRGHKAYVGGWRNNCATLTVKEIPGFYHVEWDELERAANTDGKIKTARLYSSAWLGISS